MLRAAAWLGWQVEANWADPLLFLVYAIAKPLATSLILYVMVRVVSGGADSGEMFRFLFLGNTFFLYVSEVLIGLSWAVFRDREDFETLKYIYAAPMRFLPYLIGRGATRIVTSSVGVGVALLFGHWVLGISLNLGGARLLLAAAALVVGIAVILWLGILLAGVSLLVARHSVNLNEGLSGFFFLVCGAVFPLEVLPRWVQPISLALPFTYWLELLRRILTGRAYAQSLATLTDGALWWILVGSSGVFAAAAFVGFGWCEREARKRGMLDWKSNY